METGVRPVVHEEPIASESTVARIVFGDWAGDGQDRSILGFLTIELLALALLEFSWLILVLRGVLDLDLLRGLWSGFLFLFLLAGLGLALEKLCRFRYWIFARHSLVCLNGLLMSSSSDGIRVIALGVAVGSF